MSDSIAHRIQELSRATRMLALLGAALKLQSPDEVDPGIRQQIDAGLRLVLGNAALEVGDTELAPLLTQIEMALSESAELFKHPGRAAGWQVDDRDLLQAMGRASSLAFGRIIGLAESRPTLRKALNGAFLDVGTGVGGIALRAAQSCPRLHIDAIDIWEPALRLAAENIAASPYADRIRLRHRDVQELEPGPRYTLAWLPTMFLKRAVLETAIDRIAAASRSGGWLVTALYTQADDPFAAVISSLRTLRSGGELTDHGELARMMRSRGYVDIEVDTAPVASFVFGRLA